MPAKLLKMEDQSKFHKIEHGCQNFLFRKKKKTGTVTKTKKTQGWEADQVPPTAPINSNSEVAKCRCNAYTNR